MPAQRARSLVRPGRDCICGVPTVILRLGDITRVPADAIVNAANSSLLGGGGVDGAIHAAGGPEILAECRRLRATRLRDGLPTGQAVATTAGRLPARWVIHTVGPVYRGRPEEPELLSAAYRNSLALARDIGAVTVSFPAISTGVYSYPASQAAHIALRELAAAPAGLVPMMVLWQRTILEILQQQALSAGIAVTLA